MSQRNSNITITIKWNQNPLKKTVLQKQITMDKKFLQRKLILYDAIVLLLWLSFSTYSQSVKRQCISSLGSSALCGETFISQTAGQSYFTSGSTDNNVLSGFQQPVVFTVENIGTEVLNQPEIKVFPNPAAYSISIQPTLIIENSYVIVTDVNGRTIMTDKISQLSTYTINCEGWQNGVYLITISGNIQNKQTLRVIISK